MPAGNNSGQESDSSRWLVGAGIGGAVVLAGLVGLMLTVQREPGARITGLQLLPTTLSCLFAGLTLVLTARAQKAL